MAKRPKCCFTHLLEHVQANGGAQFTPEEVALPLTCEVKR